MVPPPPDRPGAPHEETLDELEEDWRPRGNRIEEILLAAVSAAGCYLLLSVLLVLYMDFWGITNHWLIPCLLVVSLLVGLRLVRDRLQTVFLAAVLPMGLIALAFALGTAPYISQDLGLSHLVGRGILVVVPGLVAAGIMALRRR